MQVWLEFARWQAADGGSGPATAANVLSQGRKVCHFSLKLCPCSFLTDFIPLAALACTLPGEGSALLHR